MGTSPCKLNQPCWATELFKKLQEVAGRFKQSLFSLGELVGWRAWCWEPLFGRTPQVGGQDQPPASHSGQRAPSSAGCLQRGLSQYQGLRKQLLPNLVLLSLEATLACKSRLSCRLPELVTPQILVTSPDQRRAGSVHLFGHTPRALPALKYPKAYGETSMDSAEPSRPAR